MNIPEEFYKAKKERVRVYTVGELITQLKRLPEDLTLCSDHELIVYNIGDLVNVHLAIEESIE